MIKKKKEGKGDLTNIMIKVPKLLHRPYIHFGKGEQHMVVDAIVVPNFQNGRLSMVATEADDVKIAL
jgi:hypothetical protein